MLLHRLQPFRAACARIKWYHDYIRYPTQAGILRVPLASPKIIGVASSRGSRSHQEDFYAFATLSLDPTELKASVKKHFRVDWEPPLEDESSRQVVFVGIYDGHGGSAVSQYLRQELHGIFESVDKHNIPELYTWVKELGGYFKRFKGGSLAPWVHNSPDTPPLDLSARATQAFLEVDRNLSSDEVSQTCGATASVALLHSLDIPSTPFYAAKNLALTVAHCGDTRVLLCATDGRRPHTLTENHHADSRVESSRLRRMMVSSLMTDSFGESRWMGALANTRSLGDLRFKKFGVTAEPEVKTQLLQGDKWAFILLVSDGVSSIVSDNELVDLVSNSPDPKTAAERILSYVEELGGEDNMTALIIPLAGWGRTSGGDKTAELRNYRLRQAVGTERQRRM